MKRIHRCLILLALLPACNLTTPDESPAAFSITGRWSGYCAIARLELNLTGRGETFGIPGYDDVEGSGIRNDSTGPVPVTVGGFSSKTDVVLNFRCESCSGQRQNAGQFTGQWTNERTITGRYLPSGPVLGGAECPFVLGR